MKISTTIASLACLFLAAAVTPAFAHHGNHCVAKADKAKTPAARTAALKNCLAEEAAETRVKTVAQIEKEDRCRSNAKNLNLEGDKAADFLSHCFYANDAEEMLKKHEAKAAAK